MNVKIFYENIVTEFPGKLLLAAELLNNSKIKKVTIGHYKPLFFEILKEQKYTTDNSGDSVIYKDIWAGSEVFIKIFKLLKFRYYALQQEDYLIFNKKFFKNISYNFVSNKYFLLINKFFTLSKYSLELWNKNGFLQSDKLLATGNPRYEYVKKFFINNNKKR